jgi:alkaline phosphatase D
MKRRESPGPSRRALLSSAAALAGCSLTRAAPPAGPIAPAPAAKPEPNAAPEPVQPPAQRSGPTPRLPQGLFTLGVASGEPAPDGFVLWTRLAPDPLRGGGMPPEPVTVGWQVGTDEKMTTVLAEGEAIASPALAHSVHAEVVGLIPDAWYFYRFRVGSEVSPVGRTRTAPARGARVDRLSFAATSCLDWQTGHYTGFQHLYSEQLDFIVHLGDYIYEGGIDPRAVRPHDGPEVTTLEGYRNRYALYKSDPLLQAAHAAFPWVVIWDDHEVVDNYGGGFDIRGEDSQRFALRRAAAYQAFYEHMPLRSSARPNGHGLLLHRRISFGDLLDLHLLDTRQYRSLPPRRNGWTPRPSFEPPESRAASMLGPGQESWLSAGLLGSHARWNALAQGIFMAQRLYRTSERGVPMDNRDKWDGYPAARRRLTRFFAERGPLNPVVLTGDDHRTWIADLKENFDDPRSDTVGSELVCPAMSSSGDGIAASPGALAILAGNPHLKFHNGWRGYLRFRLDQRSWRTDVRVMPYVSRPGAPIATAASFVIEAFRPGVQRLA